MAYEQRDNSGTLGKNDKREKSTHPEYKGQAIIDGTAYWISAWVKESQYGKFFSLSFKPKDENPSAPSPSGIEEMEDDIPF